MVLDAKVHQNNYKDIPDVDTMSTKSEIGTQETLSFVDFTKACDKACEKNFNIDNKII